MKKLVSIMILAAMLSLPAAGIFAAEQGASPVAYEHASENSIFVRTSDWFATLGKSETDRKAIVAQRKADRAAKRAQQTAGQQKAELEKTAADALKDQEAAQKKAEKEAQKQQQQLQQQAQQAQAAQNKQQNKLQGLQ